MNVFQLFYVSNSSAECRKSDLDNIIHVAQEKNKERDLTGVLMFRANTFLQILEGKKEDVLSLYQKLHLDTRHKNLLCIFERETNQRLFTNWSMSYCEIGPIDIQMINEILSWKRQIRGKPISNEKINDFLTIFKTKKLRSSIRLTK